MSLARLFVRGCGVLALVVVCNGCACVFGPRLHSTRHIVQPGDTLDRIASIYYGCPSKVVLLQQANPGLSQNPAEPLTAGVRITVPVEIRSLSN